MSFIVWNFCEFVFFSFASADQYYIYIYIYIKCVCVGVGMGGGMTTSQDGGMTKKGNERIREGKIGAERTGGIWKNREARGEKRS